MAKINKHRGQRRLAKLPEDYERRKQEIRALGYVVSGSIQKRLYSCGKLNCRCVTQGILHGPYYQWTRKIEGKTVNINLDKQTALMVRGWIQNNRTLRKLCGRLEKISLAVLQITTNMDKV